MRFTPEFEPSRGLRVAAIGYFLIVLAVLGFVFYIMGRGLVPAVRLVGDAVGVNLSGVPDVALGSAGVLCPLVLSYFCLVVVDFVNCSAETQALTGLSRLLPPAVRSTFVDEARGNLGDCSHWWQRADHLVCLALGMPRLAWMMRRENRRGRA
jgi:hypothetical protein